MKNLYLFILFILPYQLLAQWSQVGTNLGDIESNAGVSLAFNPSSNELYVSYPDSNTSTFIIQKFDGSSWSQVGTGLGNAGSDAGVSLTFNPSTNEPYVAYPDSNTGTFIIQKFNGSSWSQVGTGLGNAGSDAGVSLAFNPSTNEPYVAYPNVNTGVLVVQKFNGSSWSQVGNDLGNSDGGPFISDPDISLAFNPSTNFPYLAYPQASTLTFKLERWDTLFWNLVGGTHLGSSRLNSGISLAFNPSTNEPYIAYTDSFTAVASSIKVRKYTGSLWSSVGNPNFDNEGSHGGISILFNPSTNEPYIAYSNNSGSFIVRKLDGVSWSQVGSNIGNAGFDSAISLVFNPSTNEPYIAYPDSAVGAIIVQKYDSTLSTPVINNSELDLQVFPNPVESELNILLGDTYSAITVKMMNLKGGVLSTQYFRDKKDLKISMNQSSGLYLLVITTDKGYSKIIKIIKN